MKKYIICIISLAFLITTGLILVLMYNNKNLDNIYNYTIFVESNTEDDIYIGSGVIYDIKENYAYIISSLHILNNSKKIYVYDSKNEKNEAEIYKSYENSDLVILKVKKTNNMKKAKLGNSNHLKIGDEIYALGTPLNYTYVNTLTKGIVSYINRNIKVKDSTFNTIQFDAPISGGNSGGPLINKNGYVVGIIFVKEENSEGISFALPINYVKKLVGEL